MAKIIIVSGAYGVGKSEFATQLALTYAPCYLADIDILNPYFRPREQAEWLKSQDVHVIGSHLKSHINQDFPALSGDLSGAITSGKPVLIDCAGSENGLKPLATFRESLVHAEVWLVVNLMRQESQISDLNKMIQIFEAMLQLKVSGLVHNTHLLDETTLDLILEAQDQLEQYAQTIGVPIVMTMISSAFESSLKSVIKNPLLCINQLIHRTTWMQKGTR